MRAFFAAMASRDKPDEKCATNKLRRSVAAS